MWITELTTKTSTADSRIGSDSASNPVMTTRSEEHTSELQSLGHLVCRLLLEKKKTYKLRFASGFSVETFLLTYLLFYAVKGKASREALDLQHCQSSSPQFCARKRSEHIKKLI